MAAALHRLMRPLAQAVRLMVARAVVNLVNDATKLQGLQITLLADEVREDVERFQNYGFTSAPHPGAEAVALSVMGMRDHTVVLAVDDRRYRLQGLQQGEVAIYTDQGDKVVLKRGGTIEVTASTKVRLVAPLVETSADLKVGGNLVAVGNVSDQNGAKSMAGMRAVYNGHNHGGSGPSASM